MIVENKETEYKDTEIGRIPKEWEVVELEDVIDEIYYGITAKAVENDTGLRMLRTTDIKNYSVNWENLPFCEITERRNNLKKYLLRKGDLIVARAGTVGISVLVKEDFEDVIFGSYLIKVRLNSRVFSKFLHYFFQTDFYWKHITKAQGSTLKNINLPLLKSLQIPLPPLPEQKKIAEILSTVDKAIEKVDEAIAKTERLKKGLMQELLTKGIGHKEFKDTEIGRIPKEWEVVRLEEISSLIKSGSTPSKKEKSYWNGNIPFVTQSDMTRVSNYLFDTLDKITETALRKYNLILFPENSILMSMYGTIGKVVINKVPVAISQNIAGITPERDITESKYLLYAIQTYSYQFTRNAKTITLKHLDLKIVRNSKVPLPPLPEQQKIAEILSTVDKKLELERKRKEKLERIKKGLMNDLLTGKRRVKVS